MTMAGGIDGRGGQRLAGGDEQLQLHEIEPGDHLGDRVFHLQAGVHLQEGERAVGGEQQLDGAGAAVPHGARRVGGCAAHAFAQVVVDGGGGGLFDDLLVTALQRAVALEQGDDVLVIVGEDLHLDVPAALHIALDEHGAVAERAGGFPLRGGNRLVELVEVADQAHSPAAATG